MFFHYSATSEDKLDKIDDLERENIHKVGYAKTFIMLFKGFIGTGILYMPRSFYNGGWFFSGMCMILSYVSPWLFLRLASWPPSSTSYAKTYKKCAWEYGE
jgi:amino acid permease